ncbi:bifunctional non-homologous end joining protein LigD, partial [Streptomyces spectabilis]|nr:bifunctional non-homologous end joining protein LigD [Streptomyces spectabilis]
HSREALELTRTHHLEGLVLKRLDSVYEPGVRSRAWIKIRNFRTVDAVIGGWLPGRGRLTGLPGAVLLGEPHHSGLRYLGSVGTGWSEHERAELAELLAIAADGVCPFTPPPPVRGAHWVLPRLVAEIRYATRTRAGLLRQPVWHRLRPDLAP